MVGIFNNKFQKNCNCSSFPSGSPQVAVDVLRFNCYREDVVKAIGLPSNTAPGPDCIFPVHIKGILASIVTPMLIICQQSFAYGKFPSEWKRAIVCPIYKKEGDKGDPANYRPVSMCSSMGKINKPIVKEQLKTHLDSMHAISPTQHDFVSGRSVVTNLLSVDRAESD